MRRTVARRRNRQRDETNFAAPVDDDPDRGAELSNKGLPANRGAKGAVSSIRPADVRSIVAELSLPNNRRALDRPGNFCRFTLLNSQSCRADPPPIKRTGAARGENLAQLRKQQR